MLWWREKRLHSIAKRLTHFELQRPDPENRDLTSTEIESFLFDRLRKGRLFLNFYSRSGLLDALNRYGTIARLQERGFRPKLSLHNMDQERDMLRVRDGNRGAIIIELVARYASLKTREAHDGLAAGLGLELLAIEWLLLQNPRADFTETKSRLPGQKYPGLGIGREVMTLLEIMANRLEREGLLAFPEHYHNGLLYDRRFRYFSPSREGELHALEQALSGLTLAEASWAVHEDLVIDRRSGKPYQWLGEEMIMPLSERLKNYFNSDYYRLTTEEAGREQNFYFDLAHLPMLRAKIAKMSKPRKRRGNEKEPEALDTLKS